MSSGFWPAANDLEDLAEATVQLADARRDVEAEPVTIDLPDLEVVRISEDPETRGLSLFVLDAHGNAAKFVTGTASWNAEAIDALGRLAEASTRLADLLRIRRGDKKPLAVPDEPPAQEPLNEPPVNAAGW